MEQQVICIGAVLVDEIYHSKDAVAPASSNPATMYRSAGGVMRNIAHHLVLLGIPTTFITVSGNDHDGEWLINECTNIGLDMSHAMVADCATGKYAAILDPDGTLFAAACTNPCENYFTIDFFEERTALLKDSSIIVADTNLSEEVLGWLIAFCDKHQITFCIEPVSVRKAKKLADLNLKGVYMITPNEDELFSSVDPGHDEKSAVEELLNRGVQRVWLTRGPLGSSLFGKNVQIDLPAIKVEVKDVTGAGDAMLAAWLAAFCLYNEEPVCMQAGHILASSVLQVKGAVDTQITEQKLFSTLKQHYANPA